MPRSAHDSLPPEAVADGQGLAVAAEALYLANLLLLLAPLGTASYPGRYALLLLAIIIAVAGQVQHEAVFHGQLAEIHRHGRGGLRIHLTGVVDGHAGGNWSTQHREPERRSLPFIKRLVECDGRPLAEGDRGPCVRAALLTVNPK